VGKLNTNEYL